MTCARRKLGSPATRIAAAAFGLTLVLLVVAGGRVHGQEPSPRTNPITVQPNLGDIDTSGGIQFAPNGKYIAVGDRSQIKLWEIASGRPLRILENTAYFEHFTFIEQGAQILSVHKDAEVRIWDPLTARLLSSTKINGLEPATDYQCNVASSRAQRPSCSRLGTGASLLWDYKKKELRGKFAFDSAKENPQSADGATLSSDGKILVAAAGAVVKRFDVATRRQINTVRLRQDLRVVPTGMIDQSTIVAKTNESDCDADLVMVTLSDAGPRYTTIDRAPGCKKMRTAAWRTTRRTTAFCWCPQQRQEPAVCRAPRRPNLQDRGSGRNSVYRSPVRR